MISLDQFPALNACLNGLTALLLIVGRVLIRQGKIDAHRFVMISAFVVSSLFLGCYLYYHFNAGRTEFPIGGLPKIIYLSILIPHTILAIVNLPLIITTLILGLKGSFAKHRRIAVWTWAIWMFVSVSGVVVYVMLYHLYPGKKVPLVSAPPAGRMAEMVRRV